MNENNFIKLNNSKLNIKKILLPSNNINYIKEFILVDILTKNKNTKNIKLKIIKYKNEITISTTETEYGKFDNLNFKIYLTKNIAKINNVNDSKDFSGKIYMEICLKIMKIFNVKIIFLDDDSQFIYPNIEPIKIKFRYDILSLIRFEETYYMQYGFLPYDKNTKENITYKIKKIINLLYDIKWIEFDNIFEEGSKTINILKKRQNIEFKLKKFIENNKSYNNNIPVELFSYKYPNINSIYLNNKDKLTNISTLYNLPNIDKNNIKKNNNKFINELKNYNTLYNLHKIPYYVENLKIWIKYWSIMEKSYKLLRDTYKSDKCKSPFIAIKKFFYKKDHFIFLSWLDLYSIQYEKFKYINKYLFYNEDINNLKKIIKIPGIEEINNLKELLNNVNWICYLKICNNNKINNII